MPGKILILEDDKFLAGKIMLILEHHGYDVKIACSSDVFFEIYDNFYPDVILLDIILTGSPLNGVEVLRMLNAERDSYAKIIVVSGLADNQQVNEIRQLGAYHFIEKGANFNINQLMLHVENALRLKRQEEQNLTLQIENINLKKQLIRSYPFIGDSQAITDVRSQIIRLASADEDMFILGETGTGKEVAVNYYYLNSVRFGKAFHTVNCSALSESLIESELFGHVKGSFTGADRNKTGFFEKCHNGVLFLDEITNLSLAAQAKILRAIEYKDIQVVGGDAKKVDTRLIFASNSSAVNLAKPDVFRRDLFYRIEGNIIELPPLRERGNDVIQLMSYFFSNYSSLYKTTDFYDLTQIEDYLMSYPWPGNIRELRNFCKYILINEKEVTNEIIIQHLETRIQKQEKVSPNALGKYIRYSDLRDAVAVFEKDFITYQLNRNRWHLSWTAKVLGVERTTLYKKMQAYKIQPKK